MPHNKVRQTVIKNLLALAMLVVTTDSFSKHTFTLNNQSSVIIGYAAKTSGTAYFGGTGGVGGHGMGIGPGERVTFSIDASYASGAWHIYVGGLNNFFIKVHFVDPSIGAAYLIFTPAGPDLQTYTYYPDYAYGGHCLKVSWGNFWLNIYDC